MPGASMTGSDVPMMRWSKSPVQRSSTHAHSASESIWRRPSREHAAGARVDDDQARAPEVAAEAPARAGDLAHGGAGEVAHELLAVAVGVLHGAEDRVVEQRATARGCRGAGRSSRTCRRRRCAPPTTASRASARSTPRRCSSRRGRRGRRRSSRWRPSTAASAAPGRSSSRGTATCTPRSRRPRRAAGRRGPRRARDELLRLGRDLVGVDLVAEQQQRVGPLLARLVAHALDEAPAARRPRGRPGRRPCSGRRARCAAPRRGRSRTPGAAARRACGCG